MKKIIITLIIGIIIGTSISTVAYNYNAKDIEYIPSDSSWSVNNVNDAIDELKMNSANIELLWTNPDVTAAFPNQTLQLNLSKYDKVLIHTNYYSGTCWYCDGYYPEAQYSLIDIGSSGYIVGMDDNLAYHTVRNVVVSITGITFETGKQWGYKLATHDNINAPIPVEIYGIKLKNTD